MKQIQVQLYPPEWPHWHGEIKKHWRSSGVFIVNFEKVSHLFLAFYCFNLGSCCQLHLSAEIKVQTSKNYESCKHRYKLCHINQTGQSKTWNETCIKFKKYADCRFWANIYKIYWDFCSVTIISFRKKTVVETISVIIW